jgi:hypothetical protein
MTNTRTFVTIVSGLPRSGTSMMMRMLEAGGMPALVDNIRVADQDNPRGYYEFEPVKQTRRDASWIPNAEGKVVKMVYRLLYDLPLDREYRVLVMRRNLDEVLRSQQKMLAKDKREDHIEDAEMAAIYKAELSRFDAWLAKQPSIKPFNVKYNEMLSDPAPIVREIDAFLGGHLDQQAMCAVVDPSLYRNRAPQSAG